MKKENYLYRKLYSPKNLHKAWNKIYENGLKSDSKDTRNQVRDFKQEEWTNINRISRQLKEGKFSFDENQARLVGPKDRPIVLTPVKSRIVQRAILDLIQNHSDFKKYQISIGSYGAIKKRGVEDAIKEVVKSIKNGACWYYKSDIKSFFTQISRQSLITRMGDLLKDSDFTQILEKATNLEVTNINSIPKDKRDLFNFENIGTPQGCCLSPLLGNILLYDFDMSINSDDIRCLRYLDDFIILGKDRKSVQGSFAKAIKILEKEGLDAYKINDDNSKAKMGAIEKGITFLGIEILGKNIRPNSESRNRLLKAVRDITDETFKSDFSNRHYREHSLTNSLYRINNKVLGWGNQYSFCNEDAIWGSLDMEISKIIKSYIGRYGATIKKHTDLKYRRRILGIHLLSESKKDVIEWE